MSECCDLSRCCVCQKKAFAKHASGGRGGRGIPEAWGTENRLVVHSWVKTQHSEMTRMSSRKGLGVAIEPLCWSSQYGLLYIYLCVPKNKNSVAYCLNSKYLGRKFWFSEIVQQVKTPVIQAQWPEFNPCNPQWMENIDSKGLSSSGLCTLAVVRPHSHTSILYMSVFF